MSEPETNNVPEQETETAAVEDKPAELESTYITYDDFAKLQIVIGTITAAEVVPDADKLLKLTVEVGEETPRQILSGIREWYPEPKALVGTQCPFLINLEPRVIRGLESQGMILAAGGGEVVSLMHPDQKLDSGTSVS